MSGGHFDYQYSNVDRLADDIEAEFINGGKYMQEDWSAEGYPKPLIEGDRIGDADDDEREVILQTINTLIADLRKCAIIAKELEWYLSGDLGAKTFLQRLKNHNLL